MHNLIHDDSINSELTHCTNIKTKQKQFFITYYNTQVCKHGIANS